MRNIMINRVIIEEGAERHQEASDILKRMQYNVKVEKSTNGTRRQKPGSLDMDKKTLRLISFPGEILKPCPGTTDYICCGYQIFQTGTNCPFNCSYCILQAYFNQPSLRVFVNIEQNLKRLESYLDCNPDKIFRIGTGEFTDSLAINHITRFGDFLIPFFNNRKNAVLELKTKTDRVHDLFSFKDRNNIILSWSLNSPIIDSKEEKGAPAIKKRLAAAGMCQKEGFALGFHFDPLIEHDGWKTHYSETLELMDQFIDPEGVIWISMGCLRFMPSLKNIIRMRHPESAILTGEFIQGQDGKMRYFKPIRIEMYSFMAEKLKKWKKDLSIYLCMESDEVWEKSIGWSPGDTEGLSRYLDSRALKYFSY